MKVFETMHEKKPYWLVFDDNNEVVYKAETLADANNFIQSTSGSKSSN